MSGYSATIALAPGWRITGRSTRTPEGKLRGFDAEIDHT